LVEDDVGFDDIDLLAMQGGSLVQVSNTLSLSLAADAVGLDDMDALASNDISIMHVSTSSYEASAT